MLASNYLLSSLLESPCDPPLLGSSFSIHAFCTHHHLDAIWSLCSWCCDNLGLRMTSQWTTTMIEGSICGKKKQNGANIRSKTPCRTVEGSHLPVSAYCIAQPEMKFSQQSLHIWMHDRIGCSLLSCWAMSGYLLGPEPQTPTHQITKKSKVSYGQGSVTEFCIENFLPSLMIARKWFDRKRIWYIYTNASAERFWKNGILRILQGKRCANRQETWCLGRAGHKSFALSNAAPASLQ